LISEQQKIIEEQEKIIKENVKDISELNEKLEKLKDNISPSEMIEELKGDHEIAMLELQTEQEKKFNKLKMILI